MIVCLVLVTLTCWSYITCWVEKPRLAAEQEEKRSVSEKHRPDQVFHKVWIKALRWILQKTFLCFMSDLIWAGLLRKRPSFTFFPAGANITTQKSSNLCVESAEMYPVQRELLTSPLSSPRRSASLCLLRKWVFLPADASCLRTLSGAHPAAASRGSGSAHRSRKKWSF